MDEKTIYKTLLRFFKSLLADFYDSSTTKELSNILTVSNPHAFASKGNEPSRSNAPLSSLITDSRLSDCVKYGIEFLRTFISKMESDGGGIPVTGGSVEAWRMDNIAVDIVAHNIKLHRASEFVVDELTAKIAQGVLILKTRWPESFLSQSYILNGFLDGKKASGTGDFKISVSNFMVDISLKFSEKGNYLKVDDFKLRADFDDVQIQVTGLVVEDSSNAEEIMNTALQRDKQKFKEMLLTNTLVLSEQTAVVLNTKLQLMTKNQIIDLINTWCDMK